MGMVLGCWRYPLKSAAAEKAGQLTVAADGVLGDRLWAVMDSDGAVVSAKHPDRGGRLLEVTAAYDGATGEVAVAVPGHAAHPAGSPAAGAALSEWLARPVTLTDVVPAGLRLRRRWPTDAGLVPEWAPGARPGQEALTEVAGAARRRFVDYGPVHLVSTGALAQLEAEHGLPVPPLRFRPNVLLDLPADPEPGTVLQVGTATLRVELPTPRCNVPSLPQPGAAEPDTRLLSVLARQHRQHVPGRGRAAVFGCYANVEEPGAIMAGDAVRALGGPH